MARIFQSTLPLRGATFSQVKKLVYFAISIHAPLTGSDLSSRGYKDSAS